MHRIRETLRPDLWGRTHSIEYFERGSKYWGSTDAGYSGWRKKVQTAEHAGRRFSRDLLDPGYSVPFGRRPRGDRPGRYLELPEGWYLSGFLTTLHGTYDQVDQRPCSPRTNSILVMLVYSHTSGDGKQQMRNFRRSCNDARRTVLKCQSATLESFPCSCDPD